ncbi:hypothetical protein EJ02DRAFT_492849, partial [Clathrospora elynae]
KLHEKYEDTQRACEKAVVFSSVTRGFAPLIHGNVFHHRAAHPPSGAQTLPKHMHNNNTQCYNNGTHSQCDCEPNLKRLTKLEEELIVQCA